MYQLTCRAHASGRGLIPVVASGGFPDPAKAGLDRWTIFVHGFNNSAKTTSTTWHDISKKLQRRQLDMRSVVLFYWPGDYSRWKVVSAMNYPGVVPIAEHTARLLADYLSQVSQRRRSPLQISFVAHSLGALVVLETIRLLRIERASILIDDVLLMAAAVPEGFCMPGETYGEAFNPATNEVALYSSADTVLRNYFQVGQKLANRFPENRRKAVGLSGGPGAGQGRRWSANAHMDGFGHSDYWKHEDSITEISRIVAAASSGPVSSHNQIQIRHDSIRRDSLPIDVLDKDERIQPSDITNWGDRPVDI